MVVAFVACGAVTEFPAGGDWSQFRVERRGKGVRFLDAQGRLAFEAHAEPAGASLEGVTFAFEKEAFVVDARAAMGKGGAVGKIVFTTPNFAGKDLFGRECALLSEAVADRRGARVSFFFEGHGRGKVGHFHESRRVLLATFPRAYRLGSAVPDDLDTLHLRFDLNDPAGATVRFRSFRWGPFAEMPAAPKAAERKAELLFRADYDGVADASFAKGEAKALAADGLSFAPGKRGQALRVAHGAKPALAYGSKGNVVPECGTVAMWVKREWPDAGYEPDGAAIYRMLFSTPVPQPRCGSGALFAWFHGAVFRGDESDLDDRYVQSNPPVGTRWTHLAMSWDESGVRLAVNGKYPSAGGTGDSDSELRRVLENPDGLGFDRVAFDRFFVGNRDGRFAFDGLIDDFRIYSAPLADAELAALYGELATAVDRVREKPDYAKLFAGNLGENPHVGGDALDLELVETVKLDAPGAVDALRAAERFGLVGDATFGRLDGRGYFESSSREGSRFALRLRLDPKVQPLYALEIDYPDDKVRTIDFIVQGVGNEPNDYAMQVGVAAGGEWPNTGRMLTHRCLLWPRASEVALVGMTAREGAPVAVSEVRVYKVRDSRLPPLRVREPKANADGWRRSFALYFEDPAVGFDFAVPSNGNTAESLSMLIDRVVADMKFTGENLFAYPGVWYQGLIGEEYNPRNHANDFLSGWYEKFDREGLFLMPTVNPNNMPVRRGLVTREALSDGSLHDSPVSIHDTGKPNWGGWHGTPPNFNIAHPDTQKWLESLVDTLLAQGVAHPSFKGICLHVTRHNMLTFGGIEAGYNDYCIEAFEQATGVKVEVSGRDKYPTRLASEGPGRDAPGATGRPGRDAPGTKDPLRGKRYAAWLRAHPEAFALWLDWRCDVVTAFWGRIAAKLKAARPDLKLWVNAFSVSRVQHDDFLKADWTTRVNREMGIDPAKLCAAAPNIIVGQSIVPADFRWRKANAFPTVDRERYRVKQRDLYKLADTWELLQGGRYPWAGQHDRYWESAIGATGSNDDWKNFKNKNASNSLDSKWMKECTWRVTTINPSGRHALAHFAAPLAFGDVLGMSKGGFLIGTYGMEDELREFMAAFRALPAVVMADVAPAKGGVVMRQADFDGKSYFYLCNTTGEPQQVDVSLPADAEELVGAGSPVADASHSDDSSVSARPRADVTWTLKPYELRSFAAPTGKPSWR